MNSLETANAVRTAEEELGVVTGHTGEIYMLLNLVNGKRYIGYTSYGIDYRWEYGHLRDARAGRKTHLCNAIRKYGADAFLRGVIENGIPLDKLGVREIFWIAFYGTFDNGVTGYNHRPGNQGGKPSDTTRAKISESWKTLPPEKYAERCENMSVAQQKRQNSLTSEQRDEIAKRKSEEHQAWWDSLTDEERAEISENMSAAGLSRWDSYTDEERAEISENMSVAQKKRRDEETDEQRAEMKKRVSVAQQKSWANMTDEERAERREKTVQTWKGKPLEEKQEHREKIRVANLDNWHSLPLEKKAERGAKIRAGLHAKKQKELREELIAAKEAGQEFLSV